jgi:hypothetical protein
MRSPSTRTTGVASETSQWTRRIGWTNRRQDLAINQGTGRVLEPIGAVCLGHVENAQDATGLERAERGLEQVAVFHVTARVCCSTSECGNKKRRSEGMRCLVPTHSCTSAAPVSQVGCAVGPAFPTRTMNDHDESRSETLKCSPSPFRRFAWHLQQLIDVLIPGCLTVVGVAKTTAPLVFLRQTVFDIILRVRFVHQ